MKIPPSPKYDLQARVVANALNKNPTALTEVQRTDILFRFFKNRTLYMPVDFLQSLVSNVTADEALLMTQPGVFGSIPERPIDNLYPYDTAIFSDGDLCAIFLAYRFQRTKESFYGKPVPSAVLFNRFQSLPGLTISYNQLAPHSQITISGNDVPHICLAFAIEAAAKASILSKVRGNGKFPPTPLGLNEIPGPEDGPRPDYPVDLDELDVYSSNLLIHYWTVNGFPNNQPHCLPRWANNYRIIQAKFKKLNYHTTSVVYHFIVPPRNAQSQLDLFQPYALEPYGKKSEFSNHIQAPLSYAFDIEFDEPTSTEDSGESLDVSPPDEPEAVSDGPESGKGVAKDPDGSGEATSDDDGSAAAPKSEGDKITHKTTIVTITASQPSGVRKVTVKRTRYRKFLRVGIAKRALSAQYYTLKKEFLGNVDKYEDLERKYLEINDTLKSIVTERNSLRDERQSLSDQLMNISILKTDLEARMNPLIDQLAAREIEMEELQFNNKTLSDKIDELTFILEDLKRDPDDIILENLELKQALDESNLKSNDLQAQLSARTLALNDANQSLQEATGELHRLKSDLKNSGEWIYPENLHDVVKAGEHYFSSKLVFHERVSQSIQSFAAAESDKKYRIVQEAVKMIKALAETMHKLKFEDNNFQDFTNLTGIPFSMTEHKLTKREREIEKSRTCKYNGETIIFYPHLKSSIQGTELRVHFQFLEEDRKILICHVGGHLPTAGTSKIN
ncbi:MAG: hypothetical protein LBF58_07650 [Deltaproteobacteria bacterium]|jgi:hypothetical protein|nr:hypothetical protein [Deltaproteobacteria bacterium]